MHNANHYEDTLDLVGASDPISDDLNFADLKVYRMHTGTPEEVAEKILAVRAERTIIMSGRLDVPFEEKDEAKLLGARWHQAGKFWYCPAGVSPALFAKWAPRPGR